MTFEEIEQVKREVLEETSKKIIDMQKQVSNYIEQYEDFDTVLFEKVFEYQKKTKELQERISEIEKKLEQENE